MGDYDDDDDYTDRLNYLDALSDQRERDEARAYNEREEQPIEELEAQCGDRPAGTSGVVCTHPAGHAGDHGDIHEAWSNINDRNSAQAHPDNDDDIPF